MKPRHYVLEQIHHRQTDPVPYTLNLNAESQERLDAHYGSDAWRQRLTPYFCKVSAFATWPQEQIDDEHFRDIWGSVWRQNPNAFHLEQPALPQPTLDGYEFPKADAFFDPAMKAQARKTLETNADSFRVVSLGWGLLERTWHTRGFENSLIDSVADPGFYEELLDRFTDLFLAFVEEVSDLPADAIMFGDNWGYQNGVILGPDRWRRFVKPRWAKVYDAVHAQGKITMSHCDGCVTEIMDDIIAIGLDVLESVQPEAMNPYELKAKWGDKITFWGGLGSQSTISFAAPGELRGEIRRLRRKMGRGGGYILGASKPPLANTPTENLVALLEEMTDPTD